MPKIQPLSDDTDDPQRANTDVRSRDDRIFDILQRLFDLLQKSTIAHREVPDPKQRFWKTYRTVAEAFDNEFLARYGGDMDTSMIFAGLFSAVCATFLSLMKPDLAQDPNTVTQALLQTLIISLNASAASAPLVPATPVWTGPSTTIVFIQCLLYASLSCSLFAALAAVLGKQWLSSFQSVGEQGNDATRGLERQRKFEALQEWHLRTVLEVVPLLLQLALLLFGAGLCAYIWIQQRTVAVVAIITNGVGALLYCSAVCLSVIFEDCPFQMPLSAKLRQWFLCIGHLFYHHIQMPLATKLRQWSLSIGHLFYHRIQVPLSAKLRQWSHSLRHSPCRHLLPSFARSSNKESQPLSKPRDRPSQPSRDEVSLNSAVRWLLSTSTDTNVQADVWPLIATNSSSDTMRTLPVNVLDRLLHDVRLCFEAKQGLEGGNSQLVLITRLQDVVASRITAFSFVFWEKLLDHTGFSETLRWIQETDPISYTELQHLEVAAVHTPSHLWPSLQLLQCTVKEISAFYMRGREGEFHAKIAVSSPIRRSNNEETFKRMLLYLTQEAAEIHTGRNAERQSHALELRASAFRDGIVSVWQSTSLDSVERIVCAFAALTASILTVVPFAGDIRGDHKMISIEMAIDMAEKILLPQLSMSGDHVSIGYHEFYEAVLPKMCIRVLDILSPPKRAERSHQWDKKVLGMLLHVFMQYLCPHHQWTKDACSDHCEEEFPSPRIVNRLSLGWRDGALTAECLRSVKVWLPLLDDTADVAANGLSKHSVITFLSQLPSFETLIVIEEHKEVRDFIMGFVCDTMTPVAAEVDGSFQAGISYRLKAHAVAHALRAFLITSNKDVLLSDLLTKIGTPEADFHSRLQALLGQLLSHAFFSLYSNLVSPDDVVADILLGAGGLSWHDNACYFDTYMPLCIRLAGRALIPYFWDRMSETRSWQCPRPDLEMNLVSLMACKRLFGLGESNTRRSEGMNSGDNVKHVQEPAAVWNTHGARCAAVAIAELQLRLWCGRLCGRREADPAPDYVLDCLSRSLSRLQAEDMETVHRHLEELQNIVQELQQNTDSLELITRGWVREGDSDKPAKMKSLIEQLQELEKALKRMLARE